MNDVLVFFLIKSFFVFFIWFDSIMYGRHTHGIIAVQCIVTCEVYFWLRTNWIRWIVSSVCRFLETNRDYSKSMIQCQPDGLPDALTPASHSNIDGLFQHVAINAHLRCSDQLFMSGSSKVYLRPGELLIVEA